MAARGQYAKGVAKRDEILASALDVIARNGYRRTSVRELADAVGLSQAGLLHYFSSKEELFQEILRKRDEVDAAHFDITLDDPQPMIDPIEGLIKVVRHNTEVPGLVQLYAQISTEAGDPDHPAREFFVQRYEAFRAQFTEAIRAQQAAGTLASDLDPDLIANIILAVTDGLQTQWMLDPSIDMAENIDYLWRLIARGPATP